MPNLDELEFLSNNDVSFTVHLLDGFYDINPKEVLEFLEDKELFAAKKHNVSKQKWLAWKKHVDTHQCSAKTHKGARCKNGNNVRGLYEFIEGVSEYCTLHQKHGIRQQ